MSDKNTTVSVVFDEDLLKKIDEAAVDLDLTRSQYLRRLAREDLERSGKLAEKNQLGLGLKQEEAA
jgi:metal-responsive CopG/Arc/MetJ family transcriptional regulator